MEEERSSIVDFFKGKDVFITGATGFMGKVLVEKLLWSCKGIGDIYVLMRNKKGVGTNERIKKFISLPVFDRIRDADPGLLSKIKPIAGNIYETNLAIDDGDMSLLENRVSVIFHVAASVRFDDSIKKAVILNARSTRDILELAKRTKNLKAVCYVSTCYSNCDNRIIKEEVYPSNYDWRTMIKLAETLDEHLLNTLQSKILKSLPNTYTFSKQLAENIVNDYSGILPCVIYRPSIGWIDSVNGPAGLVAGAITGLIHVLYVNKDTILDLIPCDYSIRGLILSAWLRANDLSDDCHVINSAIGDRYVVRQKIYADYISYESIYKMPVRKMLWYPVLFNTKSSVVFYVMTILLQVLPGMLVDAVLRIKGINFSLIRIYRTLYVANLSLGYFMFKNWKICNDNFFSLLDRLSDSDRKVFGLEIDEIDQNEVSFLGYCGIKKYILKEDISEADLDKDRNNFKRMYYLHTAMKMIFLTLFTYIAYKMLKQYGVFNI